MDSKELAIGLAVVGAVVVVYLLMKPSGASAQAGYADGAANPGAEQSPASRVGTSVRQIFTSVGDTIGTIFDAAGQPVGSSAS